MTCPDCGKTFKNLALHITKAHDSWLLEAKKELRDSYDCKTKTKVKKEIVVSWDLSKNGTFVCSFLSSWGTLVHNGKTYSDWHADDSCPYVLLVDYDSDHQHTKIVYAHNKAHSSGISKASNIFCDNLTILC